MEFGINNINLNVNMLIKVKYNEVKGTMQVITVDKGAIYD